MKKSAILKKLSQERIFEALKQKPGTFTDLKNRTGLSKNVLSGHLKQMSNGGLIERKFDSDEEMVLYHLSKRASDPRELLLRELDLICVEQLSSSISKEVRRLLTPKVWSSSLVIAKEKIESQRFRLWPDMQKFLYVYLEGLDSEVYRALLGVCLYNVEKKFLSISNDPKGQDFKEKKPGETIIRWTLSEALQMCEENKCLIAIPTVEKSKVKHKFDEFSVLLEKLSFRPPATFLFAEVANEHSFYLVRNMIDFLEKKDPKRVGIFETDSRR